ncbi:MAG TPA: DUF2795 domain-containing protein [Candidatus Saccharimonadales bacterium]|nr:DUF2795 domain-containing protein [Candidatus Saccharimonadales bacterium]
MTTDENKRIENEQNNIPGQQKDVNVKDYPSAIELANILKDINYPADKNTILNSVKSNNMDKNITDLLEKLEDKLYNNSSEVVSATGLVEK